MRPTAPEDDFDGGALVLAVDFTLVPLVAPLMGGGKMASGAIMMAFASSLTNVLSRTRSMECGTPSKL